MCIAFACSEGSMYFNTRIEQCVTFHSSEDNKKTIIYL